MLLITMIGCQAEATVPPTIVPTAPPTIVPTVESQPLPMYIARIHPEPGSSVSMVELEQEAHTFFFDPTQVISVTRVPVMPSVCLYIVFLGEIVEEGDFLSSEDWLLRMRLVLDGEIMPRPYATEFAYSIPADMLDPDSGAVIGRFPEPVSICYDAQTASPGQHTATFVVKKTSGEELAYTWSFTVTE